MSRTFTVRNIPQFMSQLFGQSLDGRFGDVVSGVSWWTSDSLFGTGVHDDGMILLMSPVVSGSAIGVASRREMTYMIGAKTWVPLRTPPKLTERMSSHF
jgi:hypothetical protein